MIRTGCRGCLLSVLLAMAATGCKGLFGSEGVPHDPMFLDKQPIEAKARIAPPAAIAYAQPVPPVNPNFADRLPALAAPQRSVPGTLTTRPHPELLDEQQDER